MEAKENMPEKPRRGPYLTKRLLVRLAKKAGKEAAAETMAVVGYVVGAEGDWVVKKYADGRVERISEIPKFKRPDHFVLD